MTRATLDPARVVAERFEESARVTERFMASCADRVPAATAAMAARFRSGGRLLVFGTGAEATDAQHVAVEFVHPVLVGKRALPALDLTADVASLTAEGGSGLAGLVRILGRPEDMALGISRGPAGAEVGRALDAARDMGMLTLALEGSAPAATADHAFVVPSDDPLLVQEAQETLYHVFWELVHVFLDREAP